MDIINKIDFILIKEINLVGSKKDKERKINKIIKYVIENPHRIPVNNWEDAFIYMGKKEDFNKKEMKTLIKHISKKKFNISFETAKKYKGKGVPLKSKLVLPVNLETFYLGK